MDLLARREHTRQELQQKLLSRLQRDADALAEAGQGGADDGVVPELLEQVLDQLEADKLLSDARFTESFVSAHSHRGYGPVYIRHRLRQKQIDDGLLQSGLEMLDQHQWQQQLIALLARKLGNAPMPEPPSKEFARLQRFVLSRGFTSAQWMEVRKQWVSRQHHSA